MNWRTVFAIQPTARAAESGGDAAALTTPGARMRSVACVHCFAPFSVPARAMVLTCPACYKRVQVADVIIDRDERFASIESGGTIAIGQAARVAADRVAAGMLLRIDGHLSARDVVAGRVELAAGATFSGNLRAGSVVISPGALIEGGAFRVDKSLIPSLPLGTAATADAGPPGAGAAPAAAPMIVLPTTPDRAPMIPAPRPIPMPATGDPAHPPGVVERGKPRQSIVAVRAWTRADTKR